MTMKNVTATAGRRVSLPGHFDVPVVLEDIRPLGVDGAAGCECRCACPTAPWVEVKGRKRGQAIRLTTNEWYKAQQLDDTYWLYVVWDPLHGPDPTPLMIRNPAKHLDHAKKLVVAARYFDVPAAVEQAARYQGKRPR